MSTRGHSKPGVTNLRAMWCLPVDVQTGDLPTKVRRLTRALAEVTAQHDVLKKRPPCLPKARYEVCGHRSRYHLYTFHSRSVRSAGRHGARLLPARRLRSLADERADDVLLSHIIAAHENGCGHDGTPRLNIAGRRPCTYPEEELPVKGPCRRSHIHRDAVRPNYGQQS
jgi:hypothetical protein